MPVTSADVLDGLEVEGIHFTQADFRDSPNADGGTYDVPAGSVEEIAITEVGEDGQLSGYDVVRPGDATDQYGQSSQGKMFVQVNDDDDNEVDDRTQIRLAARDKNSNRRVALTSWYPIRDLDRDDPRQRVPLPPVTSENGRPRLVKKGRLVCVEVKNAATDVSISLNNSVWEFPTRAGF